jgi:hypothetical protein
MRHPKIIKNPIGKNMLENSFPNITILVHTSLLDKCWARWMYQENAQWTQWDLSGIMFDPLVTKIINNQRILVIAGTCRSCCQLSLLSWIWGHETVAWN